MLLKENVTCFCTLLWRLTVYVRLVLLLAQRGCRMHRGRRLAELVLGTVHALVTCEAHVLVHGVLVGYFELLEHGRGRRSLFQDALHCRVELFLRDYRQVKLVLDMPELLCNVGLHLLVLGQDVVYVILNLVVFFNGQLDEITLVNSAESFQVLVFKVVNIFSLF